MKSYSGPLLVGSDDFEDEVSDLFRSNPGLMFARGHPVWANACVGDNGLNELPQYAAGYARAVDLLIANVLDSRGEQVDVLVYPTCFCIRHAVELHLKFVAEQLLSLPVGTPLKKAKLKDVRLSHDLGQIWDHLTGTVALADSRFEPVLRQIDGLLRRCAEIDRNGQVFRYPYSNEEDRHLVKQRLINFVGLEQGWRRLKDGLEAVRRLIEVIAEEYSWGSFTANLSRFQLYQLSLVLPPREQWGDAEFARVKSSAKEVLGVSGREFSKALAIIQSHREFAPRIGVDIPFCGFDEDAWHWVVRAWVYQYPDRLIRGREDASVSPQSTEDEDDVESEGEGLSQRRQKVWAEASERISAEFLATLHALFYFAFDLTYSEAFDHAFRETLPLMVRDQREGESAAYQAFFHVFGKTNLIRNLARSLCALGKLQWVVRLQHAIALVDCEEAIAWFEGREVK